VAGIRYYDGQNPESRALVEEQKRRDAHERLRAQVAYLLVKELGTDDTGMVVMPLTELVTRASGAVADFYLGSVP
jgi:hypothetical protein